MFRSRKLRILPACQEWRSPTSVALGSPSTIARDPHLSPRCPDHAGALSCRGGSESWRRTVGQRLMRGPTAAETVELSALLHERTSEGSRGWGLLAHGVAGV